MHVSLRLTAAVAPLLGLGGCNNVVSIEPWFSEADTKGAPDLREGLWVMISDDPCRVNLERPAERWPDCADAFYLRGKEWLTMQWDGPDRRKRAFVGWERAPILLAAGDPVILQLDEGIEPTVPAADLDEIDIGDDGPDWRYSYVAMQPTALDNQGKVVAFEFWSVQCGPSPENGPNDPILKGPVTKQPFAGLTVVGDRCVAESADALRRAAISSRSMSQPALVRWVRDGWR